MDRIKAMEVFVAVADATSFVKAAVKLGMSNSMVSMTISDLEQRIGTRLFNRTTRSVALSHDGVAYLERCIHLLNEFDEAEQAFTNEKTGIEGKLRIDMPVRIARNIVIPALPALLQQHPKLLLEVSTTDRMVDLIHEGFDCVLRSGALRDSSLVAKVIGRLQMVNCVSPSYLSAHGPIRNIAALRRHRLVGYVSQFNNKPDAFEYFDGKHTHRIGMTNSITVNNADAYEAACIAGLGIIQVPRIGVAEAIKRGSLIEILPRQVAEPMPLSMLYNGRRLLSRRLRTVMDWLAQIINNAGDTKIGLGRWC
jgi:DNA-binding transcriptional LysR family regulator